MADVPPTKVSGTDWNPTPEQRKNASDALLDLWENAEEWGDERLVEVVKETLDRLGLPWVRLGW